MRSLKMFPSFFGSGAVFNDSKYILVNSIINSINGTRVTKFFFVLFFGFKVSMLYSFLTFGGVHSFMNALNNTGIINLFQCKVAYV